MKQPKSAPKDIDEYLAGVPEPARSTLSKVRTTIRSVVPPETTEGISYQIATFKYKGPLVGFAAFTGHCTFFVMSGTLLESFRDELKSYSTSKSGIHFPLDKPLPAALIKKLVKARLALTEAKKKRSC